MASSSTSTSSSSGASPARHRQYASPPSPINVDNLVDRIRRPNAASAKKAAPWSTPRKQYDREHYTYRTYFPNKERYKRKLERFGKKQKNYHGNSTDDMSTVTRRVAAPTHSHIKRSYDTILRRRDVEQFKWQEEQTKLDLKQNQTEQRSSPRDSQSQGRCAAVPEVKHHHHHNHNRNSASSSKTRKSSSSNSR